MVNGGGRFQSLETGVRADDLIKAKYCALRNKVNGMIGYLYRLNRRIGDNGFSEDHALRPLVARALTTMGELHADLQ